MITAVWFGFFFSISLFIELKSGLSLNIGRCCTQETVRVSKAFSVGILYMQMHLSVASTSVSVLLYIGEEARAEQSKAGLAPPPHGAGACPSTLSWGSREEETASAFPSHFMGLV